jgi:outer membrane lipoprotein LolB
LTLQARKVALAQPDAARLGRRSVLAGSAIAMILLAGCAVPTRPADQNESQTEGAAWSGRLSLRIDSEPAQTFSALFELRGHPGAGELTLTSPIGSTLAQLRWSPGEALLTNGSQTRRYESVDALVEAATGAAIPVDALFGWLAGRSQPVAGWRADLTNVAAGRLQARRESPLPTADLRIVFERV